MHGVSRYKVPEGKLVEVRVDYGDKIEKVEILGDFFVHPEEAITEIEDGLRTTEISEGEQGICRRIKAMAEEKGMELIGVTPEAIAKAIMMAVDA